MFGRFCSAVWLWCSDLIQALSMARRSSRERCLGICSPHRGELPIVGMTISVDVGDGDVAVRVAAHKSISLSGGLETEPLFAVVAVSQEPHPG